MQNNRLAPLWCWQYPLENPRLTTVNLKAAIKPLKCVHIMDFSYSSVNAICTKLLWIRSDNFDS